jgi:hypothetical protein
MARDLKEIQGNNQKKVIFFQEHFVPHIAIAVATKDDFAAKTQCLDD